MATDSHRQTAVLFPDPQEHFHPTLWQAIANLDTPSLTAPTDSDSDHAPTAADTDTDTDPFVDDSDDDGSAPAFTEELHPRDLNPRDPDSYPKDGVNEPAPVPYWVSVHVPAEILVMDEPHRRFRRRRPTPPPPTPDSASASAAAPQAARVAPRSVPLGWIAAGILAVASVTGAAVVVTGHGETPAAPVAAALQPSHTPPASTTTAPTTPVAAPWCTDAATADAVTTDAAGNRTSAGGVIAAFEYAYYVQRSGTAVAALMSSPAPPERIQAVIDRTPTGTEHCVTIAAAELPDVHAVALTLRTPSGSESAIASRITTTRIGESYTIANVEELR